MPDAPEKLRDANVGIERRLAAARVGRAIGAEHGGICAGRAHGNRNRRGTVQQLFGLGRHRGEIGRDGFAETERAVQRAAEKALQPADLGRAAVVDLRRRVDRLRVDAHRELVFAAVLGHGSEGRRNGYSRQVLHQQKRALDGTEPGRPLPQHRARVALDEAALALVAHDREPPDVSFHDLHPHHAGRDRLLRSCRAGQEISLVVIELRYAAKDFRYLPAPHRCRQEPFVERREAGRLDGGGAFDHDAAQRERRHRFGRRGGPAELGQRRGLLRQQPALALLDAAVDVREIRSLLRAGPGVCGAAEQPRDQQQAHEQCRPAQARRAGRRSRGYGRYG